MDLRNLVYEAINKAIAESTSNMALGAYSHDHYLKVCGQIAGLNLAKEIIDETYRKYIGE